MGRTLWTDSDSTAGRRAPWADSFVRGSAGAKVPQSGAGTAPENCNIGRSAAIESNWPLALVGYKVGAVMTKRRMFLLAGSSACVCVCGERLLLHERHNLRFRDELRDELDRVSHHMVPYVERRTLRGAGFCSSPLLDWSKKQIRAMGHSTYKKLYDNRVLSMSYIYKHYIDKKTGEEFFHDASQTLELKRRHSKQMKFWRDADFEGRILKEDILLLSMHGSDLKDYGKIVPVIERMFEFDDISSVINFAHDVQEMIEKIPKGFNNPLLTMNAVATTTSGKTFNKNSIILGDGVLQFLYDTGLEATGPDFIHSHEFAHHVQFELDLAVPPGQNIVNDDRRKELMADALAGYWLAHDEGANMNFEGQRFFDKSCIHRVIFHFLICISLEEISEFQRAAFATGDCKTDDPSHHGLPSQRQCASIWGASLASPDDRPILDPDQFKRHFDESYEAMLALDDDACTLVEESSSYDEAGELGQYGRGDWPDVAQVSNWDAFPSDPSPNKPISLDVWLDKAEKQKQFSQEDSWETEDRQGGMPSSIADRGSYDEKPQHIQTGIQCALPWVTCPLSTATKKMGLTHSLISSFALIFTIGVL